MDRHDLVEPGAAMGVQRPPPGRGAARSDRVDRPAPHRADAEADRPVEPLRRRTTLRTDLQRGDLGEGGLCRSEGLLRSAQPDDDGDGLGAQTRHASTPRSWSDSCGGHQRAARRMCTLLSSAETRCSARRRGPRHLRTSSGNEPAGGSRPAGRDWTRNAGAARRNQAGAASPASLPMTQIRGPARTVETK